MERHGIQAEESDLSRKMARAESGRMQRLRGAQGHELDALYMDLQVKEHAEGLALLDANLPNVQNPDFSSVVREQRDMIAHHLQLARSIQDLIQPRASR